MVSYRVFEFTSRSRLMKNQFVRNIRATILLLGKRSCAALPNARFRPRAGVFRLLKREKDSLITYQRISPKICGDRDYTLRHPSLKGSSRHLVASATVASGIQDALKQHYRQLVPQLFEKSGVLVGFCFGKTFRELRPAFSLVTW